MFLDKASKRLLDKLIAGTPDFSAEVFTYECVEALGGIPQASMFKILRGLESRGLVEYSRWDTGSDIGVALTQQGVAYKELRRLEAWERWKERLMGFFTGAGLTLLAWWLATLSKAQ